MSKKTKGFVLASAFLFSLCCVIISELIAYTIHNNEYGLNSIVFKDGSEAFGLHGCEINDNTMIITGTDPQFFISTYDQSFSKVRIIFREPLKQNIILQLFYAPVGEWFSEENSVWRTINQGKKIEYIEIPKALYTALRFDFEQNVSFEGIYVGERDWKLLPYQFDFFRVGLVFAIVFLPIMIVAFGKHRNTSKNEIMQ